MNLQQEHKLWLDREFPNQDPIYPALGLVEEAGELMHALLKCTQANIWGAEARYEPHMSAEFIDAIGDCAIFACSLCNSHAAWDFEWIIGMAKRETIPLLTAMQSTTDLVRKACNVVDAPGSTAALVQFLARLLEICERWNINFNKAISTTWIKVKERTRHVKSGV